jgi:hypothetical protein
MSPTEIMGKWYALSSGHDVDPGDPFFRFLAVWVGFNALYACRTDVTGDRNQVKHFASEQLAIESHYALLKCDEEYLKAVLTLKERGVTDESSGSHYLIGDQKDLPSVLDCAYQVRCNLFHGRKLPDDLRDERLVNASYTIVSKLVRPYL